MKRLEIAGGSYGEARTDGQYAVVVGEVVETGRGYIPITPGIGTLLFLRVTPSGPFRMAGQASGGSTEGNFEFDNLSWKRVGDSYGVNPVMYDDIGYLRQGNQTVGSQGFRFADGAIAYTGDETVNDQTPDARQFGISKLWEWTSLGDVAIGQGEGNTIAVYRGVRYILDAGPGYFIRFTRDGEQLAVSVVKLAEHKTVLLWLTPADLVASFPVETPIPAPEPPPMFPPVQIDPKEPMSLPNILDTVRAVRAQYPAKIGPAQAVEALNAVALQHPGFGLLAKPNGNHGPQPVTGTFCSCDYLVHRPSGLGLDVFGNGPDSTTDPIELGDAVPQWGDGAPFDLARFVAPVAVGTVPAPTPTPTTPAPGGTVIDFGPMLSPLFAKVAALEAVTKAQAEALAALRASIEAETRATSVLDGARIALRTANGHFVCAEGGGGGDIHSRRDAVGGDWEIFTVEVQA